MSSVPPAPPGGASLALHEWGEGPGRALLLHGLGSSGATWWRIAASLSRRGFAVCAPDLRGHGRSQRATSYRAADYAADLRQLGGGWDLVVGHSLGGAIAVDALDRDPELTSRLVLIDPVLALTDAEWQALATAHLDEVRRPPSAWALSRAYPRWHLRDAQLKAQAVRRASTGAILRTLEDNRPWDFRPQASRLRCDTIILAADDSAGALLTPALVRGLSGLNSTLVVRTVKGAGHSIHRERPTAVVNAIDDLLLQRAAA